MPATCECFDTGCPVHPGRRCLEPGELKLYRVDWSNDDSGVLFCTDCADDAFESGIYRGAE